MTDTARTHAHRSTAAPLGPPPPETGVSVAAEATPAAAGQEPDVGRTAMIGAAVGFAVATIAITVLGILGGLGAASAFGLAAFVGIWGGAGFGMMMGATIPLARHLDASHPVRRPVHDDGRPSTP